MDNEIPGPSQGISVTDPDSATEGFNSSEDMKNEVRELEQFWQNVNEDWTTPGPAPITTLGTIHKFMEIPIKFPYKENPYQLGMMEAIIKTLKTGTNCLLESPNGTGKTAALLCSVLGWQRECYDRQDYGRAVLNQAISTMGRCLCSCLPSPSESSNDIGPSSSSASPPLKKKKMHDSKSNDMEYENKCGYCIKKDILSKMDSVTRPPLIYYVTRTHSQIRQAIEQLKNTHYKNTKMSISASRKQTCLSGLKERNPTLSANDICRISRNKCKFYHPKNEGDQFTTFQQKGAFDLKELKQEGRKCTKCPYYGGIEMSEDADIIFCTYNYLLNPSIRRKTIGNKYLNSVIVFDEAHNVEDACREALTFTFEVEQLEKTIKSFNKPITTVVRGEAGDATEPPLRKLLAQLSNWCTTVKEGAVDEEWMGSKLGEKLAEFGITSQTVNECLEGIKPYAKITVPAGEIEDIATDVGYPKKQVLARRIEEFLQNLQQTLAYFCKEPWEEGIGGMEDFSGTIIRNRPNYSLHICCLNPAIAFRHLRNSTHSIIAASGTLKPFASIAEELKTVFWSPDLSGIDSRNIWAGVVTHGIKNTSKELNLLHRNQEDETIHDEVGKIISEICGIVPNGVLVLFPSYALMNGMKKSWERQPQESSVIGRIAEHKPFFFEDPSDLQKFEQDFNKFKECAKQTKGSILFAVFGGKFSEGIDFKDELARAVITVGIPFPKRYDPFVSLKRSYNGTQAKSLGRWDWYETRAYRSLRQGIGRCIRHPNDWGAVIMIEERLGSGKFYDRSISELVGNAQGLYSRNSVESFLTFKDGLAEFIKRMNNN